MAVNIKKEFGTTRSRKPELSTLIYGKVPPQAPDLEEAVIGAILLERDTMELLFEVIQDPEVFYVDAHQRIFKAIREMYEKGIPIDLLTVTEQLRKTNELELIGGAYALTMLSMKVLSSAHVEAHARIIVEKYKGRELIRICGYAMLEGYEDTDIFDAIEKTEIAMYQLSSIGMKKKAKPISHGIIDVMKKLGNLIERNVDFTGINTGFPPLNDLTGGWQKTDFIVIAARPSVGKTAFVINASLNAAFDSTYGGPVAIFSLEMEEGQIIERMLSCISGVPLDHIRKPKKLDTDKCELERINAAAQRLSQVKIHIDDTAGLRSLELRAKARKLVSQHGVKLIIIDYLQLMETDTDRGDNREQQVSKISRDLKKLAKDLDIPIIALSQMSRGIDTEKRAPQLSDLRESGAIEQDADLVMFLYRPTDKTIEKHPELKGKILGSIAKHRNGQTDDVAFNANNIIQRWTESSSFTGDDAQAYYLKGDYKPTISDDDLPF